MPKGHNGQVENQVQTIWRRFFQPRLKFASLQKLNGWLEVECRRWAAMQSHPEPRDMTVAEALAAERPALQPMRHHSTASMRPGMR